MGNFAGDSRVNPRVKVETDNETGEFSGTFPAPDPFLSADPRAPQGGLKTYAVDVRCLGPDGEHDSGGISRNAPEFTYTDLAAPTTSTTAPAATTTAPAPSPVAQPQPTQSAAQASSSTVAPGDPLVVTGGGFAPGADVTATLFSDPVVLGATRADANGRFSIRVTIPVGTSPGVHRIVVSGRGPHGGAHESIVTVTVAARAGQPLVRTGADSGGLTGMAVLVILAGALLLLLARPRRARARFG